MSIMTLQIHPPTIREPSSVISTPTTDERPSFPSIGLEISRPPSTSSQASSHHLHNRPSPVPGLRLPGLSQLSALASAATSTRASPDSAGPPSNSHVLFRHPLIQQAMNTATPSATVGPGGQPPLCQNCGTFTTPLWRRDENGSVLCNACGLFLKLHGRPRPISLKTDVIKSRNRVRAQNGAAGRKRASLQGGLTEQTAAEAVKRAADSQQTAVEALRRSASPISRIGTPSDTHLSNIAPQSMFDSVTIDPQAPFYSPSLQDPTLRASSPSPRTDSLVQLENHPPYTMILQQATKLQIRVSELEVINSLFRGRVAELEATQEDAKSKEQVAREAEEIARQEATSAHSREMELKRRIDALESELAELKDTPRRKRRRLSPLTGN